MVPIEGEQYFTYDIRETTTDTKELTASVWHREFHFKDTKFVQNWNYDWLCLAYVSIDNCNKNCGTHIMYYNKEGRCRIIELQIKPMQFILFQDSKFLHKIPDNQEHTVPTERITRKIHRIYIRTKQNHQPCDERFKFHTRNIDPDSALSTNKKLPTPTIHNINFEKVYTQRMRETLFAKMNLMDQNEERGGKKKKTHKKEITKKRKYKKIKTQKRNYKKKKI